MSIKRTLKLILIKKIYFLNHLCDVNAKKKLESLRIIINLFKINLSKQKMLKNKLIFCLTLI